MLLSYYRGEPTSSTPHASLFTVLEACAVVDSLLATMYALATLTAFFSRLLARMSGQHHSMQQPQQAQRDAHQQQSRTNS